jgi:hypothetical protein
MENSEFVREELQAVTELRHGNIQTELQGRVDVACRREEARLKAVGDAKKEAARKAECERRRAELEWEKNAPRRVAEAAANAEAERKARYRERKSALLAMRKKEDEAEEQQLKYGGFGAQGAKGTKEQYVRRKHHLHWLKEKVARDDAKKHAKQNEVSPMKGRMRVKDRDALQQHAVQHRRRKAQARKRLVKQLRKHGSIKDVFNEMDVDNSGDVSFKEFCVSRYALPCPAMLYTMLCYVIYHVLLSSVESKHESLIMKRPAPCMFGPQEWCDLQGLGILYKEQQTELMGEIDSDGNGRLTRAELMHFLQQDASECSESSESAQTKGTPPRCPPPAVMLPTVPLPQSQDYDSVSETKEPLSRALPNMQAQTRHDKRQAVQAQQLSANPQLGFLLLLPPDQGASLGGRPATAASCFPIRRTTSRACSPTAVLAAAAKGRIGASSLPLLQRLLSISSDQIVL